MCSFFSPRRGKSANKTRLEGLIECRNGKGVNEWVEKTVKISNPGEAVESLRMNPVWVD